jgi:hypothetical protein
MSGVCLNSTIDLKKGQITRFESILRGQGKRIEMWLKIRTFVFTSFFNRINGIQSPEWRELKTA